MVLVHRKSQIQQLQLSIISIKQVSPCGTIFPSPSHILPQAVQRGAFLRIPLRVVAIRLADILLERLNPIDLAGLFERT